MKISKQILKKRVKSILANSKVNSIVVPNNSNDKTFYYVSGITEGQFLYSTAVATQSRSVVLVSKMEEAEAQAAKIDYVVFKDGKDYVKQLQKLSNGAIGYNGSMLSANSLARLRRIAKVADVSSAIDKTRMIKDEHEIALVIKACKIATKSLNETLPRLEEGMTEQQFAAELERNMKLNGGEKPSFDTIVAFGKNSATPHHQTGAKKLKKGDFVLVDFGTEWKKYCSDITRTFVFKKANDKQIKMYNSVLDIQKKSLRSIKTGANGFNITRTAVDFVKKNSIGVMNHGLGHGIGLDVHDANSRLSDFKKLPVNYISSCEPGSYKLGFGGVRIEDDVVTTKTGSKILTNFSRELKILK